MLAEIQATCLCLLVTTHAYLLYKCKSWEDERHDFTAWIRDSSAKFDEDFGEVGAILDDIAEGLGPSAADPKISQDTHPSGDIKSILTDLFINKMMMPKIHGTQASKVGQVLKGELIPTSEQIQERIQHQERGDKLHHGGRIHEDDVQDEPSSLPN